MTQPSMILDDVARTDALLCLDMYRHRRPLHHLRAIDEDYTEVVQLFYKSWLHPDKPFPKVASVYRILSPYQSIGKYANYRYQVALNRRKPTNTVERLLFHGTTRYCTLGETTDSVLLCGKAQCSMCSIIAHSYDISKAGHKNTFQRFGAGIYTTACSSKADSYFEDVQPGSKFRFVVLNRVVVGKERRVHHHRHHTFNARKYDSLHALAGEELNYEETVVYNNDAILPAYLIVYCDPHDIPPPKRNFVDKVKGLFHIPLVV